MLMEKSLLEKAFKFRFRFEVQQSRRRPAAAYLIEEGYRQELQRHPGHSEMNFFAFA